MSNNHPLESFYYCPRCGSERFHAYDQKSNRCKQCGFHLYNNASAAVAAFIRDNQGKLLLCRRAKEPSLNMLDLPGGFVDINETAEDALRRELHEELGVEVVEMRYCFSIPNTYEFSQFTVHTLDLFYEVKIENLNNICCQDDVSSYPCYALDEIIPEQTALNSLRHAILIYIETHKH